MKQVDDYRAKINMWAANPVVVPLPTPPELPRFASVTFSNHSEMNDWKRALLRRVAHETVARQLNDGLARPFGIAEPFESNHSPSNSLE